MPRRRPPSILAIALVLSSIGAEAVFAQEAWDVMQPRWETRQLDDIRNTADIQYVMLGGILYDADSLDEVWPKQRPYGTYPWVDDAAIRSNERRIGVWDGRR